MLVTMRIGVAISKPSPNRYCLLPTVSSTRTLVLARGSVPLEQDTRFELALSAWKADVLAANTNPAYLIPVFEMETGKTILSVSTL